jgi:hypothetical protein
VTASKGASSVLSRAVNAQLGSKEVDCITPDRRSQPTRYRNAADDRSLAQGNKGSLQLVQRACAAQVGSLSAAHQSSSPTKDGLHGVKLYHCDSAWDGHSTRKPYINPTLPTRHLCKYPIAAPARLARILATPPLPLIAACSQRLVASRYSLGRALLEDGSPTRLFDAVHLSTTTTTTTTTIAAASAQATIQHHGKQRRRCLQPRMAKLLQ